ncbi:histidinol-phosphate transaminase [Desulforamulus aeronauticus]|uniref:Histidinol-phosphate aminotransferase n=1 Tax=Desulforamulus aeronauticus DSM 10349 TaxID=1121421 RepID=A0A1M6R964_9FIRM|nr:histidinol-phosphate transaminase [Desulforamulus aeronauticus]SHK29004.1 histidinol-phosphate aminotransferase [Desulforamulus aeronauticus DSM 10349]
MVFPFDLSSIVRKDLDKLVAYDAHLYSDVVKLDANENPYPFPAEVAQRLGELIADEMLSRYPDGEAVALRRDIAAYVGVSPEQLMVGNGSDELILNILLTFGTGGRVLITNPTFSMYRIHCLVAGAKPIPVPRREDFSLDVPALLCYARKPDSRVLFICSPNNPTGNASTLEEIESVLQAVNCLVVVDQAYLEFGGQDCLPLLQRYPHLVILRTFSKAYALAGLRVGYMIGNPDVLRQIKKVKQPFNLNSFSQAAARLVLQHREVFAQQIQDIIESRNKLWQELQGMAGVTPYPSVTNYILFRTNYESKTVYQGLLDKGILIRKLGGPELPGFLRVSVGTPEQNQRFIQALSAVLAELGGE